MLSKKWNLDGVQAFGCNVISTGKYRWKLKVNKTCAHGFMFGIFDIHSDAKSISKTDINNKPNSAYAWDSIFCQLTKYEYATTWTGTNSYGQRAFTDSIVCIYDDLINLSLPYSINDKNYGKVSEIKQSKYRLAVSFLHYDEIELLDSQQ